MIRRALSLLALSALAPACSNSAGDLTIRVQIVPAAGVSLAGKTLTARRLSGGAATTLATAAPGATSVDLPPQSLALGDVVELTDGAATDGGAASATLRGRSAGVDATMLAGAGLTVVVGRAGGFSTAPDTLDAPVAGFVAERVLGRFVMFASAASTATTIYDLGAWQTLHDQPPLPLGPSTLADAQGTVLALGGSASEWIDLTDDTSPYSVATPPAGLAWSELVGGRAVHAPDGTVYVVGATRAAGTATTKILRIAADGTLAALALATPRLGAAAAWVPSYGVVVAGGSASGAGVEIVSGDAVGSLPYPADATSGAALAAIDGTHALLVGGVSLVDKSAAPPRVLDLTCSAACAAAPTGASAPDLVSATAMAESGGVLAVGPAADGTTHAHWAADPRGAFVEAPLVAARSGAVAIATGSGTMLVAGGTDASGAGVATLEVFAAP